MDFDFEDLDAAVPSTAVEEENLAAARRAADRAAADLAAPRGGRAGGASARGSTAADVAFRRCSACRELAGLGPAAAPHFAALEALAEAGEEEDYDVRRAAKEALRQLRAAGVRPSAAEEPSEAAWAGAEYFAEEPRAVFSRAAAVDPVIAAARSKPLRGPRVLLMIFGEILPMRLELEPGRDSLTPAELTEIWEQRWGVQYAGRVRFRAPPGSDRRWVHPRDELVPRSPIIVELEAGSGAILSDLAGALRQYGALTLEEVDALRAYEQAQREEVAEAQRRSNAEAAERTRRVLESGGGGRQAAASAAAARAALAAPGGRFSQASGLRPAMASAAAPPLGGAPGRPPLQLLPDASSMRRPPR